MATHQFTINLGTVDFSKLETEADFRREAQRFLPEALDQVGKKAAEIVWNEMQKSFRGIPGFKVNSSSSDKSRFIQEAGQNYRRQARSEDRRKVEDQIVRQLREQKHQKERSFLEA